MAKTCYFCGQPATTREHIPGRAFYPEQKDLPAGSPDVRENMLIVPAMARMDPDDGGREVEEALEGQAITLVGGPRNGWGGLNVLCVLHDVHTAALMKEHGVRRIATRDTDFHRFDFLEPFDPAP